MPTRSVCLPYMFSFWVLAAAVGCAGPTADLGGADADASVEAQALSDGALLTLQNTQSRLLLDVSGPAKATPGTVVQANGGQKPSQKWRLKAASAGAFALINADSGLALDNPGPGQAPGSRLAQSDYQDQPSAQWQLRATPGGYQLVNVQAQLCLDNSSGGTQAGNPIQLWTCANKSAEMVWKIRAADAAGQDPAPPAGASAAGNYSLAQMSKDLQQVLRERAPVYSNRNLGNPNNFALWTPAKLQSLYAGIQAAHTVFFPQLSLADLAHLVLAEGAQESTGDPNMPGWSVGFIQATPSTVGADYARFGTPVGDVLNANTRNQYLEPSVNIAYWAWYGYNAVAAGESLNEVAIGNPRGGVTRDLGNCLIDWNQGPHVDRWGPGGAARKQALTAQVAGRKGEAYLKAYLAGQTANTQDYLQRVGDYFVQAGFGTPERFAALLDTPTGAELIATKLK